MAAVNNWNEAIFLTAFLSGDILLLASFLMHVKTGDLICRHTTCRLAPWMCSFTLQNMCRQRRFR